MSSVYEIVDANAIVSYNSSSHYSNEQPTPLCEASVLNIEVLFMMIMVVFCNFKKFLILKRLSAKNFSNVSQRFSVVIITVGLKRTILVRSACIGKLSRNE